MLPIEDLRAKIQQLNLTKTEKTIAEYLLDNINTVGLYTVTELSQKIGVSDTSIIRFVRTLGYNGYADFRREINSNLIDQHFETLSPNERFIATRENFDKNSLIARVINKNIENIHKCSENISMDAINEIAQLLLSSKAKHIVGFRGAGTCAVYMARKLRFCTPNVWCCTYAESAAIEHMVDLTAEDCVLIYSFPRYSELNRTILEIAKKAGARTVLITDKVTSPLAKGADIVITAPVCSVGFTNSYAAPLCISEMILLAVIAQRSEKDDSRVRMMEEYIDRHELY